MEGLVPVNYHLKLFPDLTNFVFTGKLSFTCQIHNPTSQIKLHVLDLEVQKITFHNSELTFDAASFSTDLEKQELTISLPRTIDGLWVIDIDYRGEINDKMAGFYRSKYKVDDDERYCAVTQFQESDARRAFPCVDEPGNKATFDIEMTIPEHLTAISNNAVKEVQRENGKKTIIFHQTPKMSTYLVFFGYGEFEFIETFLNDKPIRVYASPGKVENHGGFSLDFGKKSLEYCLDFFQAIYPLPKMDLIATPDFAFGAMENYGAILFRETALLHYPGITSIIQENGIRIVIAHEIAHQWFGNLVSPSHWKYIWLNESFATYFAYKVVDHYFPENNLWEFFLLAMTNGALARDAYKGTVPIELPGKDRVFMTPRSGPILYNKGGSILRQIANYLGHDDFKRGMQSYLDTFKFGVATSDDLWNKLEEVSGKPVQELMKSWVLQRGYPMIEVKREGTHLKLRQKKYSFLPNQSETIWQIPIYVVEYYYNHPEKKYYHLMTDITDELTISDDAIAFKLNGDYTGFYRVKYEKSELDRLGQLVANKTLDAIDRWGLEYDMYAFLRSKDISFNDYLTFVEYYDNEDNHLAVRSIINHLVTIHRNAHGEQEQRVAEIGRKFVENAIDRYGISKQEGEDLNITSLRGALIDAGVRFDSESISQYAMAQFDQIKLDQVVDPNIMATIFNIGARKTNDYEYFLNRFKNAKSERESQMMIQAFANFSDLQLLEKIKETAFELIPGRNWHVFIGSLVTNAEVKDGLWHWFIANLDNFEGLHSSLYQNVLTQLIPVCEKHKDDVKQFFEEYLKKNEKFLDAVEVALETMEINAQLREQLVG